MNAATLTHPMYHALGVYVAFGVCSTVLLVIQAWQVTIEGRHHSARAFGYFCLATAAWAMADTMALLGPTEAWSRFWIVNIRVTAICAVAAFWIWFCTAYTLPIKAAGGQRLITVFTVVSLLFIAISWSPFREQLIHAYELEQHQHLWHPVQRQAGQLHIPYVVFTLSAAAVGLVLLVVFLFRAGPDSRWQILLVLLGTGIAGTVSTLSSFGYLGSHALDKSVYSMPVMVLLLTAACFRFGFLTSSPVLLRALMTAIPNPVLVLDKHLNLVEANAAGLQLLSQASAMPGRPLLLPCHDLRARLTNSPELADFLFFDFFGARMFKLSGEDACVMHGQRLPLEPKYGRKGGTLIVLRDETEQQQLVQDLQQYGRYVAHELKNPLTSIMALAEVLRTQVPDESSQQIVSELLTSGERMRTIIQELLLAGIPRPGVEDLGPVDIRQATEQVVERIRSESPTVEIVIVTPAPWPAVLGRRTWVEQILSNLIENALEHGGSGAVRVLARIEAQHLRISIVDGGTGPGFRTTQYSGATELPATSLARKRGMGLYPRGLGLSVVRYLVERSGGRMGIETPRRRATTAWFTMPLASDS